MGNKTTTLETTTPPTTAIVSKRTDMHIFNPNDITVNQDQRGRFTPPTEDQIRDLAISIHNYGQQQPVQVRKSNQMVLLTMGFTRYDAIQMLLKGFEHEGVVYHMPEIMVKALISNTNDEGAFINNIIENAHRNQTTPIDDAHNQEKLRDRYGKDDAEIAKLYGHSVQHVQNLMRLLSLNKKHQLLIQNKQMPFSAAMDLLDVPEDKRDEIIQEAQSEDGKVKGTTIRKRVRDHHTTPNETTAPKAADKPKSKVRSAKELKEFFEAESLVEGKSAEFAKKMIEFINGTISDDAFKTAWDKCFSLAKTSHASLV